MKTLDEVIKGFECCENTDCDNCPYKILFNDDSYVPCDQFSKDEDALHYLKEYRAILPLVPSLINTAIAVQKKGKTIG